MRGFNNDSSSLAPAAKKPRNAEFEKSMKDLNHAFVSSVRHTVKRNPSYSLVPMVKDYLYHSRVLLEQHKKDSSNAMLNGINLPPKSFKGLGEFFEDFEKNYIDFKGDSGGGGGGGVNSGDMMTPPQSSTSAAFFNKTGSPMALSDPSLKTSANFSFSSSSTSSSTPTTHTITFNAFGSTTASTSTSTTTESTSQKTTTLVPSPLFPKSNSEAPKPPPPSFLTSTLPSMSQPFKLGSSPPSLGLGGAPPSSISPMKSSSETAIKPSLPPPPAAAPFKGFSFFSTPPNPLTSNSTSTSLATASTATATAPANSEEKNNDEEADEDEPPKVEIVQVKEDDALYSIRCKVYGLVDGKYKDKGVGMLYVKQIEGGKYQIVVRADNNLGTVILNILLQKSLPLEKNSKNNIMTVDLTANDKKGMPIMIRVKTEDDANELLKKLKEYQQLS